MKFERLQRARLDKKLTSRSRCLETGLFLNSIGIQFLLQNCNVQAVDTFREAYFIIRRVCLGKGVSTEYMHMTMDRVRHNVTHPHCDKPARIVLEILETSKDDDEIGCNVHRDDVLQHILETAPSSLIAFLIQMREHPTHCLRQEIAIIEHNLAIALFCYGTKSSSSKEALRLSEKAALSFLGMRRKRSSDTGLLCLTIATLNSYLHLLQENDKEDSILLCYEILGQCRDAACDKMERLEQLEHY